MDEDRSKWYSSYGSVTVLRIFDLLGLQLSQEDLLNITRHPNSSYYQLLQVPLKNIFNGILLDQGTDYREYAQKIIIDYLISGAANISEDQKPTGASSDLEDMRTQLIEEGDKFDLLQFEHHKLIMMSQKTLIKQSKSLPMPIQISDETTDESIAELIKPFVEQADDVARRAKDFRSQFYQMILSARALLNTIPNYFTQFEQEIEHLEALYFDETLGLENQETSQ